MYTICRRSKCGVIIPKILSCVFGGEDVVLYIRFWSVPVPFLFIINFCIFCCQLDSRF